MNVAQWYAQVRADDECDIAPQIDTLHEYARSGVHVAVELGVRDGNSTAVLLHGLAHTRDAHLWSVDRDPFGRSDIRPHPPWWTFIQGYDLAQAVLDQLPDAIELLFIDTDHSYAHTTAELAMYWPRMAHGGHVLAHDTENEDPAAHGEDIGAQPPFPVRAAVADFCEAKGLIACFDTRGYGMADIRVP